MWLPIRFKIIVPFAVLLVFVGIIGSGVATARLTDAATAAFDANLLHSSLLANQAVAQTEAARLADLRLATDTVGVPESLAANDIAGLTRLLTPIAGNVTTASIQLRVLDANGREGLRIQGSRGSSGPVAVTNPSEFAMEPAVVKVLAGEPDPEMREYLRGEIADKEQRQAQLVARLRELLVPTDPNDGRNVIATPFMQ